MDDERESRESVLLACPENDDNDNLWNWLLTPFNKKINKKNPKRDFYTTELIDKNVLYYLMGL